MKESKDRQREYRARQAERLEKLKKLGLVEYRLVVPQQVASASSAFHRLAQTISKLYLNEQDFLNELPAPDNLEAERLYISSGAPQLIEFQIDGLGSVGLKMIPYRSIPTFCWMPLKANPADACRLDLDRFIEQFPMFKRAYGLSGFHWRSRVYIDICSDLGIDSQWNAPEFRPEFDTLGWSLLDWDADNQAKLTDPDGYDARSFVFDVLDLLRTDKHRDSSVSAMQTKSTMGKIKPLLSKFGVPGLDLVERVLSERGLLNQQSNSSSCKTIIKFLPSFFGRGYGASIYGEIDGVNKDGWRPGAYRSVAGVAEMPELSDSWTLTVIDRLRRENGVIFLSKEKADDYMETEGRYWQFSHGIPIDITNFERFLWRVKPPKTPISDYAREASIAAHILNQ